MDSFGNSCKIFLSSVINFQFNVEFGKNKKGMLLNSCIPFLLIETLSRIEQWSIRSGWNTEPHP